MTPSERGHGTEVAGRVVRHVELRLHRPLAARVGDERVAHGVVGRVRGHRLLDGPERGPVPVPPSSAIAQDPMTLQFYNTLTRRKEPFTPADPARVTMYVCGLTVYNFPHIGNARSAVVFDVLARLQDHP